MSRTEVFVLQHRLRNAFGDATEMKSIARKLIDKVGDVGAASIERRLERELTLLGEHVESTQSMRAALSKLRRTR